LPCAGCHIVSLGLSPGPDATIVDVSIEVRRAGSRFVTTAPGRVTHHSFSFGAHYDPANTSFGLLLCHNDDAVEPGAGYDDHPHRDLEIVTWVLSGALTHADSSGPSGVVEPGQVQVLSAGSGIVHSETVQPDAGPTRFVQAWVRPDSPGGTPSYTTATVEPGPTWTPLASGARPDAATRIRARGATLWVADAAAGERLVLPDAPDVHLFVATGAVEVAGVSFGTADAARVSGLPETVTVVEDSQLMAWAFE
jgi:hypothetical protein